MALNAVRACALPLGRILPRIALALAASAAITLSSAADAPHFSEEASRVERVLSLENERLALMPAVAAWKWQHHAQVVDPGRERIVIAAAARAAARFGLDSGPIEHLFELQVRLASTVESDRQREWRERGFDFRRPIPDLALELRPRLDRLTDELIRALYLAAPALTRSGFEERYAALAGRRLTAAGWTPDTRRALLAALGAIRLAPFVRAPDAASRLDRIRRSGVLRIGTTGDYAPFTSAKGGELSGIDIELARSLAQALDVEAVFVRTSWPELLDDLRNGAFDVAVGGISATPARAAAAALSVPYFSGGKTIAARCTDASRFGSLAAADRPGVRVVVNPGGTNEQFVREHLRRAAILVDPDNATLFDELAAGRADVVITDDTEVELQVRRHPGLCRTLPGTLSHADKVILVARDPALLSAVNGWLRRELAAGVPSRLMRAALGE